MSGEQLTLFAILGAVFGLLIWGRVRYDLVAFSALLVAVAVGAVPTAQAFSGFAHPATLIIAFVLIISRGLSNSGVIERIGGLLIRAGRSLFMHIGVMSSAAALMSALMNNVAALALLMPVDLRAAAKAGRNPALSLMPLSFASILGGMITMIGTPPNIIIASFRGDALGEPFGMFAFTAVGAAVATVGVAFIALIGWRLLRVNQREDAEKKLFEISEYVAELHVSEKSSLIDKEIDELDAQAEQLDIDIIGLVRGGQRFAGQARGKKIRNRDALVIKADAEAIDAFVGAFGLEYTQTKKDEPGDAFIGEDMALLEIVVPKGARIEGRTATNESLLRRHGVTLLGVSRQGQNFRNRVRKLTIRAGDVLLLIGPNERLSDVGALLGGMPLQERDLQVVQRDKAWITLGAFALAILGATFGKVELPIALGAVCVVMVACNIVPAREIYTAVEWPVIVLLGSLLPLGAALEASGGTAWIAANIISAVEGYGAVAVLTVLMAVTMTLSDVLDNTATTVIAAPIALDLAAHLNANPDAFLMAVAVAASCAFLTPVGHKNNTLIMGPGGYRFGDYWRMGLPLEIIVIAVGVPMILWVWPL